MILESLARIITHQCGILAESADSSKPLSPSCKAGTMPARPLRRWCDVINHDDWHCPVASVRQRRLRALAGYPVTWENRSVDGFSCLARGSFTVLWETHSGDLPR